MLAENPVESFIFDHDICGRPQKVLIFRLTPEYPALRYMITNRYFVHDKKFKLELSFCPQSAAMMNSLLQTDRLIKVRELFLNLGFLEQIRDHFDSTNSPFDKAEAISSVDGLDLSQRRARAASR